MSPGVLCPLDRGCRLEKRPDAGRVLVGAQADQAQRDVGVDLTPGGARAGEVDDIAHAVSFFVSDGAGFVSGQVLYVAGGPKA